MKDAHALDSQSLHIKSKSGKSNTKNPGERH